MSPATDQSAMGPCRLLFDPPAAGDWNMAVDEALLESAAVSGGCSVRFYQWSPATLSLGYFQSAADRTSHGPSADCPLVRRPSGGGAIVHDRELTYSVALPAAHPLARRPQALYETMHRTLIETLAEFGAAAELCQGAAAERPGREPFLCFQRRANGDLLVGGHKIAGSAQRRRAGAILQHGSVLLDASPAAPELPGLAQLTSNSTAASDLADRWAPRIAGGLCASMEPATLSAGEIAHAERLRAAKFGHPTWNLRR